MKVLIMVLSCMKPPYDRLYKTQLETFESIKVDNVETYFYFADEYELMHVSFRNALIDVWEKDWDIIFRTNSSSYINKRKLKDFLENKSGTIWIGDENGYNSGAGFMISRDLAKILMCEIKDDKYPYEDLLIHKILESKGYLCQKGYRCIYDHSSKYFSDTYHIRVKSDFYDIDRQMDIDAMKYIHNKLINYK